MRVSQDKGCAFVLFAGLAAIIESVFGGTTFGRFIAATLVFIAMLFLLVGIAEGLKSYSQDVGGWLNYLGFFAVIGIAVFFMISCKKRASSQAPAGFSTICPSHLKL